MVGLALGLQPTAPPPTAPGQCNALSPQGYQSGPILLSPSVSVWNAPTLSSGLPTGAPHPAAASAESTVPWPLRPWEPSCPSPPTAPPSLPLPPSLLLSLHLGFFYSVAQICLCGEFTARPACLNYLKAQYSRLCHKAFPFPVFYFSV